jgi:hypothetical protein
MIKDLIVKETIFWNLFCTEKVWKIILEKDKDLTAKDLWFIKFQNYYIKEKYME